MLLPAVTGSGVSTFATPMSTVVAAAWTVVVAVPVLLAAFVSPVVAAVALLVMTVPPGVAALTPTTSVRVPVPPAAIAAVLVAVTVPALLVHVKPVPVHETNVVFAGNGSVNVMAPAAAEPVPLLVSVIV